MESSSKKEHYRQWVFWTGIFNIVGYAAVMCPLTLKIFIDISNRLGNAFGLRGTVLSIPENVNDVIMINLVGLLVVFLGIYLIMTSLNIEKRVFLFYSLISIHRTGGELNL